jgi:hypothetical protein
VAKYFCTLYKYTFGDVEVHQDKDKHSRLLEVMDILPYLLQQYGIGMCTTCLLLSTCWLECELIVCRLVG